MSTALDLEVDLKASRPARAAHVAPTGGKGPTHGMVQNPNRKPCDKCRRWKFIYDACHNCGQPGTGKRPTDARPPSTPRRRVNELVITEEGELDAHYEQDVQCHEVEHIEFAEAVEE